MQFAQIAMNNYLLDHAYDEMFSAPGELHKHYELLMGHFSSLPADELQRRKQAADLSFLKQGITFTVYGRQEGTEKIFPYDLLPRIITAAEWSKVEHGLMQRITALRVPVIARGHGVATAAGCQLVATCDLAIAAETARFATPGVNIGLFCSTPMVALSRVVPRKQAMEMLLTGDPIDAATALKLGLVNSAFVAATSPA